MRLQNREVMVTGAGSGIGEGIARRFGTEGARLIVNDINVTGGKRVARDIAKDGGTVRFVQADVTVDADWARLVGSAVDPRATRRGVNNAGWTYTAKPTIEVTEAEFDRTFAVNVKSILSKKDGARD